MSSKVFADGIPLRSSYECRSGQIYLFDKLIKYPKRKVNFLNSIATAQATLAVEQARNLRKPARIKYVKALIKELKLTLASLTDCNKGNLSKLVFTQLTGNYSGGYNAEAYDLIPFPSIGGTMTMAIGQVATNSTVDIVFDETFAEAVGSNSYNFSFPTGGLSFPGEIVFSHPNHGEVRVKMIDPYNLQFRINDINGTPFSLEFYITFDANYNAINGNIYAYLDSLIFAQGNILLSRNPAY